MKPGLEAIGLTKVRRGRKVLDGVNLEARPGELVGLLGPNGAGKTTCFGVLTGRVGGYSGTVRLDGQALDRLPPYRRARAGLSELAQAPALFQGLSARANLEVVLELQPGAGPPSERRSMALGLLRRVGLAHLEKARSETLSGGERRRLEIARALAVPGRILLLDEPFAGVDPKTVEDLSVLVRTLLQSPVDADTLDGPRGMGVVLSDHDARAVLAVCDRVVLLVEGQVVAHGAPAEIVASRVARQRYLGSRFRL